MKAKKISDSICDERAKSARSSRQALDEAIAALSIRTDDRTENTGISESLANSGSFAETSAHRPAGLDDQFVNTLVEKYSVQDAESLRKNLNSSINRYQFNSNPRTEHINEAIKTLAEISDQARKLAPKLSVKVLRKSEQDLIFSRAPKEWGSRTEFMIWLSELAVNLKILAGAAKNATDAIDLTNSSKKNRRGPAPNSAMLEFVRSLLKIYTHITGRDAGKSQHCRNFISVILAEIGEPRLDSAINGIIQRVLASPNR